MSAARTVLRKRIWETEEVQALLAKRTPENTARTDRDLRNLAVLSPHSHEDDDSICRDCAVVWGLCGSDDPIERARAGLLDKSSVLTEIVPESHPRAPDTGGDVLPVQVDCSDAEMASVAADMAISPSGYAPSMGHWSEAKFEAPVFGTTADAMRLINADWAIDRSRQVPTGHDGHDVNVVIIDEGLNEEYLRSIGSDLNFFGGMVDRNPRRPEPGKYFNPFGAAHSWHGNMIARNILRLAPKARIYDAPLLPNRVTNIEAFTSDVDLLYEGIRKARQLSPYADQPWILVNAWAVADNIQEYDQKLPHRLLYSVGEDHSTNQLIQSMSQEFDIVFAAGNFGEFAPVQGAGIYNRGPDRSIAGANALSGVLTVGACDVTGRWIGTSSQGDGPQSLKYGAQDAGKPNICAPSWFSENTDSNQQNTGASAACATAVGLLASLRTRMGHLTPHEMLEQLKAHAITTADTKWSERMGYGVIQNLP